MASVLFKINKSEQNDAKSIFHIGYLLYPKTRKEQLVKESGYPYFMPLSVSWQNHVRAEFFPRP